MGHLTPQEQEDAIQHCQTILGRLAPNDDRFDHFPRAGSGDCHECQRPTIVLRTVGRYDVCVDCLLRRITAAAKGAVAA